MTDGQKLQRINEILDRWYEAEDWRGVRSVQALTSVGGIITLDAGYLRADKRITITTAGHEGCFYEIKPLDYQFESSGPGYFDVATGCLGVAIDLGDHTNGQRRYQLTGDTTVLDAFTYKAVLRKRYVWATDTTPIVIPDCYTALELSVRARHMEDEGAFDTSRGLWQDVWTMLDSNLGQFEQGNDFGSMPLDPLCSVPQFAAI